jgi:hypothetical protein
MKKPSGLCEWYRPPWPTDIVGVRMVSPPTLNCPPERYRNFAASFTICKSGRRWAGFTCNFRRAYLVESWEYVIRKLNFGDSCVSHWSKADAKSCNALLRQWGIEDTFAPWNSLQNYESISWEIGLPNSSASPYTPPEWYKVSILFMKANFSPLYT